MFGLGMGELLVIFMLFVLFFGTKKIPELGGSLGKAIVNFKKGLQGGYDEDKNDKDDKKELKQG